MERQNFNIKIYEACSDDELRPVTMCVHFINNYAYASDGIIIVKQSMEYHSVLNPEILNGKSIHRDNFRDIMKFEIVECTEEGILCKDNDGRTAIFDYYKGDGNIPDFESILKKQEFNPIPFIGLMPKHLNRLGGCMHSPTGIFRLRFQAIDKIVFVDAPDIPNQIGVIMPAILTENLFQ